MFGVDSTELLLVIVVAIVVIGPKDLPRALYKVGQVVGKARAMSRHFRSGLDAMIREAELEELQKQWAKENARIMAETQVPAPGGRMTPLPDAASAPATASDAPPPPAAEDTEPTPPAAPPPGETVRPKGEAAS